MAGLEEKRGEKRTVFTHKKSNNLDECTKLLA